MMQVHSNVCGCGGNSSVSRVFSNVMDPLPIDVVFRGPGAPRRSHAAMQIRRSPLGAARTSLRVGKRTPSIVRRKHLLSGLVFRLQCLHRICPSKSAAPHVVSTIPKSCGWNPTARRERYTTAGCRAAQKDRRDLALALAPGGIRIKTTNQKLIKIGRFVSERRRDRFRR